jgi:hypothetical protein
VRLHADRLQLLPQPPLPEVSKRSRTRVACRARGRAIAGPVLPRRLLAAGPNRRNFPKRVAEAIAGEGIAAGLPVEIWFQDEMRVGQKNGLVYQWAKKGTRPRQPKDQRYANAYVFGAICPARDLGTALVLPRADASAMQHHLDEISRRVAAGAHAVLTLDKAGWHTTRKLQVPSNIVITHPARADWALATSAAGCARAWRMAVRALAAAFIG